MDLSKRVFYDWVVVEYARAQIPEPWVAYSDDGGRTFYHNHLKEQTQWEHPLRNTFYALLGKVGRTRASTSTTTTCSTT